MIVHVNVLELVTPDDFSLVTCHCALRYKQKPEIKPKLSTVLKIRDSKKALPRSCPVFKHTANVSLLIFIDMVQQVEKLILLFDAKKTS